MKYNYSRRLSYPVKVGKVIIGGDNPVRLQSMTNTSTLDTDASTAQILRIEKAGGEIVRLTTQGVKEARNMELIKQRLMYLGSDVPLVADVHFNPKAAYEAAATCDKVRINPGNFADPVHTFKNIEFSDEQYANELKRIQKSFADFVKVCICYGTAIRIGVNHGSLSDRIMSRYGDTPLGMVESVMEYLRVCKDMRFFNVVLSIKASNTAVMTETVKLLVKKMDEEDMHFPLHLGVTEAGNGEDARVKSAVGIGALLAEGYGDTIRVSLSEDPEKEIPVARKLADYISRRKNHSPIVEPQKIAPGISRNYAAPFPEAFVPPTKLFTATDSDTLPDGWHYTDASSEPVSFSDTLPVILTSRNTNRVGEIASWIDRFVSAGGRNPIIIKLNFGTDDQEELLIEAGADFGALLLGGYGSGILIDAPQFGYAVKQALAMTLLQATRIYMSRTEYIACPGCGRTLFDLQTTLKKVKDSTSHLKGLKIGVMGCVVNGPGEMADADYGYVGAGPGKVSIYKGKQLIIKNIDQNRALSSLIEIIKENGDWTEPEAHCHA